MSSHSLEEKLESPGFTPAARDVDAVFSLLGSGDDDVAKRAERALSRLGDRAARLAMERFAESKAPLRARLCSLVGRVFGAVPDASLGEWLVERLPDPDLKTRRRAASALGKTRDSKYEAPLLTAFRAATTEPEQRAMAKALGSAGRAEALAALSTVEGTDDELSRIVREGHVKIERTLLRADRSGIRMDVTPKSPVHLLLHVRAGLENLLLSEIGTRWKARQAGRGRVAFDLASPLRDVFHARTFLSIGFPIEPEPVQGGDVAASVVRALTSESAYAIFSTFTRGPIRYRLDWASAGRRRRTTFDVAARVRSVRPDLVNDPSAAPWEVVVNVGGTAERAVVRLELWPQGLVDDRFSYRRVALPASSHPTVAAALVRIAGVVATDVVWDPFVGAGTELVERALLGPYVALYGTDVDERALDAARQNLRAASVSRWELAVGDARSSGPPRPPSLVVTNPPFGRRVLQPHEIRPLLEAVLQNVANRMEEGGRLVWVSPMPRVTLEAARVAGFSLAKGFDVDLGGIQGEIQELRIGKRTAKRGAPRR